MALPRLLIVVALLATVVIAKAGWLGDEERDNSTKATVVDARPAAAGERGDGTEGTEGLPARLALGQMVVARFNGRNPPSRFLERIERGEVGGVILFEENLGGGDAAIAGRIERLQGAATRGDNPPLLIMVDQEGGEVKRLAGPPHEAAARMSLGEARREGEATGKLLDELGIDVDLAPVADIGHPGSFLGSRAFDTRPGEVADLACEFSAGLRSEGVVATLKHFPGLGRATVNTDEAPVTVAAPAAELRRGYAPYRRCGSEPLTMVMIDSARYPALTDDQPAVVSPLTYRRELPRAGVGGDVVTISDDLETPAIQNLSGPARNAILAGLDLLLYAGSESTSADAYLRLHEDVRSGAIPRRTVKAAAAKILALKDEL